MKVSKGKMDTDYQRLPEKVSTLPQKSQNCVNVLPAFFPVVG
jgi:hypothetical protein